MGGSSAQRDISIPPRKTMFLTMLARFEWCASREFTPYRRRKQLELQKVLLGL